MEEEENSAGKAEKAANNNAISRNFSKEKAPK